MCNSDRQIISLNLKKKSTKIFICEGSIKYWQESNQKERQMKERKTTAAKNTHIHTSWRSDMSKLKLCFQRKHMKKREPRKRNVEFMICANLSVHIWHYVRIYNTRDACCKKECYVKNCYTSVKSRLSLYWHTYMVFVIPAGGIQARISKQCHNARHYNGIHALYCG